MAFDAFALILTMLGIGMLFARLRVLPDNAIGPTARFPLRMAGFSSTRRERSAAAASKSSGLQ